MSTIGNRLYFPESNLPEGKSGFGKMGFGEPGWAKAVSRPFGTPFKPIRPEVGRINHKPTRITSLSTVAAFAKAQVELSKTKPHNPNDVTIPSADKDSGVKKAIESCEK